MRVSRRSVQPDDSAAWPGVHTHRERCPFCGCGNCPGHCEGCSPEASLFVACARMGGASRRSFHCIGSQHSRAPGERVDPCGYVHGRRVFNRHQRWIHGSLLETLPRTYFRARDTLNREKSGDLEGRASRIAYDGKESIRRSRLVGRNRCERVQLAPTGQCARPNKKPSFPEHGLVPDEPGPSRNALDSRRETGHERLHAYPAVSPAAR